MNRERERERNHQSREAICQGQAVFTQSMQGCGSTLSHISTMSATQNEGSSNNHHHNQGNAAMEPGSEERSPEMRPRSLSLAPKKKEAVEVKNLTKRLRSLTMNAQEGLLVPVSPINRGTLLFGNSRFGFHQFNG
jgi:hypothetical protein